MQSYIVGYILFYLIITYLVGSIPAGYWLGKVLKGIDIRTVGSGSTGATNVYRNIGKIAGVSVFVLDFLKGYLPVAFAIALETGGAWRMMNGSAFPGNVLSEGDWIDANHLLPVLLAMTALVGHSRSIFLGFKGGKSAATGLGTLFALDFRVGAFTFLTWMIVLYIGKMVSVASILATAMCIPLMIFFRPIPSYIIYCILGFIYVTARHKANIGRILAGTEPKIGGVSK